MRLACGTLGLALLVLPAGISGDPLGAGDPRNDGDGAYAAEAVDRITRTVAVTPTRRVRVEVTIGDVTITGSNRRDITVDIVRHAPRAEDLIRLPPVIDETSDLVRITSLQPEDGRDPRIKSDIVMSVPATTSFDAVRVFEGQVHISGLANGCDVDVRRGGIEATAVAGRVRLESGIGSIDLKEPALTPGGMVRLRVFNGPVRVSLDRVPADARILALTFNGTIASDVPLAMKDKFGPRFGEATLGTGDPVLSVDVVTGDIAIRVRNR